MADQGQPVGLLRNVNNFGELTPEQMRLLRRDAIKPIALDPLPAYEDAYRDPSLATFTNAGVQTATAALKPAAAIGLLLGGYGAAALQDAGVLNMAANAQSASSDRARARAAAAEGKAAADKAKAEAAILNAKTEAERQAAELRKREADDALERERRASGQAEYQRAVQKAEALRNQELARDRRFSETAVGKVYDKTGGAAAFLAPFAVGLGQRLAMGPGNSAVSKYVAPFVEGGAMAYGVNSLPLYYDAYATEASNPTKQAYGVYGRELPAGHPRKEEALRYAGPESEGGLPDMNPVRATAQRELKDGFWSRLGMSAIEGTMGPLGYAMGNLPRRMAGKVGEVVEGSAAMPGRAAAGYQRGLAASDMAAAERMALPKPPPALPRPQQPVGIAAPTPRAQPTPAAAAEPIQMPNSRLQAELMVNAGLLPASILERFPR